MAAGILPEPGTKYGPCVEQCNHRDCEMTREMAKSLCTVCGTEIGYDTRFYQTRDENGRTYSHAKCVEK